MTEASSGLNIRAFVALVIAFSGCGLPVTGIANHLYGFDPPSVTRHAWMSAHNVLGLLFVVFSTWHIALNRRPLLRHLHGVAARIPTVSREALLAGAVVALGLFLFVGHALHVPG